MYKRKNDGLPYGESNGSIGRYVPKGLDCCPNLDDCPIVPENVFIQETPYYTPQEMMDIGLVGEYMACGTSVIDEKSGKILKHNATVIDETNAYGSPGWMVPCIGYSTYESWIENGTGGEVIKRTKPKAKSIAF